MWPSHAALAQVPALAEVKSWAIQLVKTNFDEIAQSDFDLVVIDYGLVKERSIPAMTPEVIERLRATPKGKRRIILSYFSIGEAEEYRYYWQPDWLVHKPDWLGPENPNWPHNYPVRYWYADWQSKLFGTPDAYLDRILAAGFDGVFLDGIDKFEVWQDQYPAAAADMIELVSKVAAYGRERRKDFLIVPQNADELLRNPKFVSVIDGIGREELLYGERVVGTRNSKDSINYSLKNLRYMRRAGKPVFAIEYINQRLLADSVMREINKLGFLGYIGTHDLNVLRPALADCARRDCFR